MRRLFFSALALCLLTAQPALSQANDNSKPTVGGPSHWAIETNLVSWANFGTMNIGASGAVSKNAILHGDVRWNPWQFSTGTSGSVAPSTRELTLDFGFRWYFFCSYSGWWLGGKIQYEDYCKGGVIHKDWVEQGDAFGLGIGAGYSLMIWKNLNLDFGLYAWGGPTIYARYSSVDDGKLLESGTKWFILPDDVRISLVYVF